MGASTTLGRPLLLLLCAALAAGYSPLLSSRVRPHRNAAAAMASSDAVADSSVPTGPDPYRLVVDELDYIKRSIKKMLTSKKGDSGTSALSSNGVLTMAAREFMSRKGKSFRPMLVLLVGRATGPDFVTDTRHAKLAVISEMIHTASLIHADVLEEHETDATQGTVVHQEVALEVGNKVRVEPPPLLLLPPRGKSYPRVGVLRLRQCPTAAISAAPPACLPRDSTPRSRARAVVP